MRARLPDHQGSAEVDGVGIGYEVFGSGPRTLLMAPSWAISNSRLWKAQVPWLAQRFRVITFDARGTGRSDRPQDPALYGHDVRDAIAVLDATGTERALLVGLSLGASTALFTAALHGDRAAGVMAISSTVPLLVSYPWREQPFEGDRGDEGWERFSRASWRRDYAGFVEFFYREIFQEPHSEKQVEDGVGWGLDSGRDVLEHTMDAPPRSTRREEVERLVAGVRCPVRVVHGDLDRITPIACGRRVAELTGGELIELEGSGHVPARGGPGRDKGLIPEVAPPP